MLIGAYTVRDLCWPYLLSPFFWELTVPPDQKWVCELGWVKHRALHLSMVSEPAWDKNVVLPGMGSSESCPKNVSIWTLFAKQKTEPSIQVVRTVYSIGSGEKGWQTLGKSLNLCWNKDPSSLKSFDQDHLEVSDIWRWELSFSCYLGIEPRQPLKPQSSADYFSVQEQGFSGTQIIATGVLTQNKLLRTFLDFWDGFRCVYHCILKSQVADQSH